MCVAGGGIKAKSARHSRQEPQHAGSSFLLSVSPCCLPLLQRCTASLYHGAMLIRHHETFLSASTLPPFSPFQSIGVATRPDAPNYIDGQLRRSPEQQLCRKSAKLQSAAFSHCLLPPFSYKLAHEGALTARRHGTFAHRRRAPPIQG